MLQKLNKREEGFTIIEVLIVLAIAALILLIVFLAVPALQRNSRNTQRREDVSRISSAVQEFIDNNNGTLPTNADQGAVRNLFGTLAYYTNANVTIPNNPSFPATVTSVDNVHIYTSATCGTNNGQEAAVAGTTRQYAVEYAVETGSNPTPQCISS